MPRCRIPVTAALRETLTRQVRGQGGFQDLLRDIGERAKSDFIVLTDEEVGRIRKYAQDYGEGGFEDRLKALIEAINTYYV